MYVCFVSSKYMDAGFEKLIIDSQLVAFHDLISVGFALSIV